MEIVGKSRPKERERRKKRLEAAHRRMEKAKGAEQKKDDFIKELEPVQMPTYDWKECFKAIEKDVVQ